MTTRPHDATDRLSVAVAVVGGGAAGVTAAAHLLRAGRETGSEVVVHLFEPAPEPGAGVAYGTTDDQHLLNVPAAGMSAWPDRPTHFADWAGRVGATLTDGFAGRPDYARYLRSVLDDARAAAPPGGLTVHRTAAVDLLDAHGADGAPGDGGPARTVVGADGTRVAADLVVVATGWSGAGHGGLPDHPGVLTSPALGATWPDGRPPGVPLAGEVVVLGAGLTGIDTALGALRADPGRRVTLVSRTGQLPRAHLRGPLPVWTLGPGGFDRLAGEGDLDLSAVRTAVLGELAAARAAGTPWQSVMEALKPRAAELWLRLPETDRREFLHTDLRRWDVHRHRTAPSVAEQVAAAQRSGRLRVVAARADVSVADGRLRVGLVPADRTVAGELFPAAVVDCRGWTAAGVADPAGFGAALRRRGLARADALGLSLDTCADGHLLDRDGHPARDLVAIGPARRAATWESTAMGAIREQAAALAREQVREHRSRLASRDRRLSV